VACSAAKRNDSNKIVDGCGSQDFLTFSTNLPASTNAEALGVTDVAEAGIDATRRRFHWMNLGSICDECCWWVL